MNKFLLSVILVVYVQHSVYGYRQFREQIPNGEFVPSPCNRNLIWQGVGHQAKSGGGPRNPFGKDFAGEGFTWTETLCRKDSDADGRTNGEELGDPNCVWKQGTIPERTTGIAHPGICDPYNSTECISKNSFLDCTKMAFQCDAVDSDKDIKVVDVRLNKSSVPAVETTYMCQVLDLPVDKDYHLVAGKPFIDNADVMHHIVVYGCTDDAKFEPKHLSPNTCFMNRLEGCTDVIAIWAIGSSGICYHKDAGFRIGPNGYKKALIELHWNNPFKVSTYTDGSGMSLYLTPNLRPNDAGIFYIGQMYLEIPPGVERYTANSTCTSKCIQEKMKDRISIVGAFNHMHYLGVSASSYITTDDGRVLHLSHEETYSYDSPKFVVLDEPLVLEEDYNIQLKCHYKSTSKKTTTFWGESTSDEMCYTFLMYYPKNNWIGDECGSYKQYDTCSYDPDLRKGPVCDFMELANYTHPKTIARTTRLYSTCEPGVCKDGCLDTVRDIFNDPCFQEHNLERQKSSMRSNNGDPAMKSAIMEYFYRIDSCNAELAREKCGTKPWPDTSSSNSNFIDLAFVLFLNMLVFYFVY
ncbi:dopamine beta-hydroxylase-like isoform X1 [Ruditapes philippinarum]|uniref:dopamine beta-hydroxylase-like isoform X1 n=1 Tax=Ruditapes philippinarum TaxID=129788 RepID=UPI00295BC0B1|nr:dopamine beta-hydroxylase-like isoform X1 [Ruditapes philippinarum]